LKFRESPTPRTGYGGAKAARARALNRKPGDDDGKDRKKKGSKGRSGSRSSRSSSSSSSYSSKSGSQGVKRVKAATAKNTNGDDSVIILDEEPIQPVVRKEVEVNMDHVNLGVKELKELLTAAGMSFAGATEKEDLVRLLTKARAQAAASKDVFVPTYSWREVPEGVSLPPGLEVKFDIASGRNYAKMTRPDPPPR